MYLAVTFCIVVAAHSLSPFSCILHTNRWIKPFAGGSSRRHTNFFQRSYVSLCFQVNRGGCRGQMFMHISWIWCLRLVEQPVYHLSLENGNSRSSTPHSLHGGFSHLKFMRGTATQRRSPYIQFRRGWSRCRECSQRCNWSPTCRSRVTGAGLPFAYAAPGANVVSGGSALKRHLRRDATLFLFSSLRSRAPLSRLLSPRVAFFLLPFFLLRRFSPTSRDNNEVTSTPPI